MLEAKNIFKFTRTGNSILTDINFALPKGKTVCILGNNGAGKSTLLKICAGILNKSSGRILVDGLNIHSIPIEQRPKKISWLPQNLSKFENVLAEEFLSLNDYFQNNISSFIEKFSHEENSFNEYYNLLDKEDNFGIKRFLFSDINKLLRKKVE